MVCTTERSTMCWTKLAPAPATHDLCQPFERRGTNVLEGDRGQWPLSGQGCDIAVEADGDVYVDWRDFAGNASRSERSVCPLCSFGRRRWPVLWQGVKSSPTWLEAYNPFDTARDCGDGSIACPSRVRVPRGAASSRDYVRSHGTAPGVFAIYKRSGSSHGGSEQHVLLLSRARHGGAVQGLRRPFARRRPDLDAGLGSGFAGRAPVLPRRGRVRWEPG